VLRVCTRWTCRWCRARGTGLSRRDAPRFRLVLSLAKFNRILALDPVARLARVQPGVRISRSPRRRRPTACTTRRTVVADRLHDRGNIAENAGGVHCLKYGLTVHNVLRVRGLTIEARCSRSQRGAGLPGARPCSRWRSAPRNAAGRHRGHGQAGCPSRSWRGWYRVLRRRDEGGQSGRRRDAAGIIPRPGDDGPEGHARVEPFVKAGYDLDAQAILLASPTARPRGRGGESRGSSRCSRFGRDRDARVRIGGAAPALLVGAQERISAAERISPTTTAWTARSRAEPRPMLVAIEQMGEKYRLRCMNVFHAGDGNLHPLIMSTPTIRRVAPRRGVRRRDPGECVEYGGTVTGEHAWASRRSIRCACSSRRRSAPAFFAVKRAFDRRAC